MKTVVPACQLSLELDFKTTEMNAQTFSWTLELGETKSKSVLLLLLILVLACKIV